MKRQIVPNDNSCLFTSIDYLLTGEFRSQAAGELRQDCVNYIKTYSEKFDELYLGKPTEEYCEWLLQDFSWGKCYHFYTVYRAY